MNTELSIIALGVVFYVYHMWRDRFFIPNPVAFFIWTTVGVANVVTYKSPNFWGVPAVMLLLNIAAFLISVVRMKRRKLAKVGPEEIACLLIAAGVLLARWAMHVDSVTGNVFAQIAVAIGFIPLVRHIRRTVHEEPLLPWFLWVIGCLIMSVHALHDWNLDPSRLLKEKLVELSYLFLLGVIGNGIVVATSFHNRMRRP